jgi:hypothetical protein
MLFSNNLTDLPIGIFSPLENLQILLLNTNHLRCLRSGVFTRLGRLQLLSLYDNHIQAIANGTFSPFESSLQTLHLAKNPLICDCNMVCNIYIRYAAVRNSKLVFRNGSGNFWYTQHLLTLFKDFIRYKYYIF